VSDPFWQLPLSAWDGARIVEFLDEGVREGDHLEYKAALPYRDTGKWNVSDDLLETITAMANSSDGLVIVGVEADKRGYPSRVTGLPHPSPEKAVRDRCASDIGPAVRIDVQIIDLPSGGSDPNEQVMLIRVLRGTNPPYVLRDRGVYLRNDEHDRPARRPDLDALYARSSFREAESTSPWFEATNDIALTANQFLETPWPIILVGLTPAFPRQPVEMRRDQDLRFRQLCINALDYDVEPFLEPGGVSVQPEENCAARHGFSSARAFGDGTVEIKRFFIGADEEPNGLRNIGVGALWRDLKRILAAGATWPLEACQFTGELLYVMALGNIAGSRLVLPNELSLELLSAADRGGAARVNRRPMWSARGEWDPGSVPPDEIIEREFASLARVLQCAWWERLGPAVRKWASG
jgi:Putative DNA-binding domain